MDLSRPIAPDPYLYLPSVGSFSVESDDFASGGRLDVRHAASGAGGADISPHLRWSGAPEGTVEYAVTCIDPDAPTGSGWWHWLLLGLSASTTQLATDAAREALPAGAYHLRNDSGSYEWAGMYPPPGDHDHRYMFVVHALHTPVAIDPDTPGGQVGFNLTFATSARAITVGTYSH